MIVNRFQGMELEHLPLGPGGALAPFARRLIEAIRKA